VGTDELAEQLISNPRWAWQEGMRDRAGVRVVDLDLWDGTGALPDLDDFATAGVLLGALAAGDWLSDVVRQGDDWIVAVDVGSEGLKGWAAESLGRAAAYAMLAVWETPSGQAGEA